MEDRKKTTSMDSSFPILLPEDPCLRMEPGKFKDYTFALVAKSNRVKNQREDDAADDTTERLARQLEIRDTVTQDDRTTVTPSSGNTFVDALSQEEHSSGEHIPSPEELKAKGLTLTDNAGVTHDSTESALLDLFHTLQGRIHKGSRSALTSLLDDSWEKDSLATLKTIWHCRSIHLGKGERSIFYVALGWLKENHPQTLLENLPWLTRGVIEKAPKKEKDEEGPVIIVDQQATGVDDFEVVNGVSHGYWKDLLNLLTISANDGFELKDPDLVLKKKASDQNSNSETTEDNASDVQNALPKAKKRARERSHHEKLWKKFETDGFHRALHYTVSRMFADQLKRDKHVLETGTKQQIKQISLCAKWAPSLERSHDKQTLIATTISEILFPAETIKEKGDTREIYLKRAREKYRASILSPLRKALEVVERNVSASNFADIDYAKVFAKKDHDNFLKYLLEVQSGKNSISGSVLMPGQLVHKWTASKKDEITRLVLNNQWETLVQRIRDNGSLSDSLAVCDVSGSMTLESDGGCTMLEDAIGLSLVLSDVTKAPFGGRLITFSESPEIVTIEEEGSRIPFNEKIEKAKRLPWGGNTDFLAVFTKVILPLAIRHKVKPEDMVKRLFVFSDMQFDQARGASDPWATHYQIIEKEYKAAGYKVPEMIFWNLSRYQRFYTAAPVKSDMPGTALVSGRNQAMLKVFLEGGSFDEVEEVIETETKEADGFSVVEKNTSMSAYSIFMKAIGHKAYNMLRVID